MNIKLSIIIVNFNTGKNLVDCIASIQENADNLDLEIIVVDNASKDDSRRVINKLRQKFANIQAIFNTKNFGFAKAANQGIARARANYILLLNPDTVVQKNAFKKWVDFAEENKKTGAVGARLLNPDGTIQPSCFNFPSIKNAVSEFWLGQEEVFSKFYPKTGNPVKVDAVVGAALLIPKRVIEKVGLLDERYFMYFEDLDYCRRVKKAGFDVYYLPTAKVVHYLGVSGSSLTTQPDQWRRLIPSSKIYHGVVRHYIINFIIWSGQRILLSGQGRD